LREDTTIASRGTRTCSGGHHVGPAIDGDPHIVRWDPHKSMWGPYY
jgi:hypothetical protein